MNIVMTTKGERLNIRIRPDIKDDLRVAAELKGLSISGLIHHLIVKTIREEKERDPARFQKALEVLIDDIGKIEDKSESKRNKNAA